jgi:hypothetical protein
MFLRDLLLVETELNATELYHRGDGQHLRTLIDLINSDYELPVDPSKRDKLGDTVRIDKSEVPALQAALDIVNDKSAFKAALPKKVKMYVNGALEMHPTSVIFKGKEFTGLEGDKPKKSYNAGHLAELFMGLVVSAKFFNIGNTITTEQVLDMIGYIDSRIEGKNYVFTIVRNISYPEMGNKTDSLSFLARIPAKSAEAFITMAKARKFDSDLQAVFASAVRYVNESKSVAESCSKVRKDKNNNKIDVISDGTSDAKGTKADLTLKVDGEKINLLSLKTYGSDTLGQFSGLSYDNLSKWFRINFNLDIAPYKNQFDPTLGEDQIEKNLIKFYDDIVYPHVQKTVEDQKPGVEAQIVKQLAHAANVYARGETLEDVEIVKLDDKVSSGSYKILKFSDNLKDAMAHFDLETRYINKGTGRTIQIWAKPTEGEKVAKGANRLCQFRTQKTGGYIRNYFESGPMLEALTAAEYNSQASVVPKGGTAMSTTHSTRELK